MRGQENGNMNVVMMMMWIWNALDKILHSATRKSHAQKFIPEELVDAVLRNDVGNCSARRGFSNCFIMRITGFFKLING